MQFPSFKTIVPEAEQAIYRAKEKNRKDISKMRNKNGGRPVPAIFRQNEKEPAARIRRQQALFMIYRRFRSKAPQGLYRRLTNLSRAL